jgi:hypothetical protein
MGRVDLVASHLFPSLPVTTQSGVRYFRGLERFRLYDTRRLPGREASEVEPPSLSVRFCCDKPWPAADETDEGWMKYEGEAHKLVADGVPRETLSGASQWSDHTDSDPIGTVEAQKQRILRTVGQIPRTLVVSDPVFLTLQTHRRILNRLRNAGIVGREELRMVFDLDHFLVARAEIWNKDALLCYVPAEPGPQKMALGYTFRWDSYYDVQLVEPKAGFYWANVSA